MENTITMAIHVEKRENGYYSVVTAGPNETEQDAIAGANAMLAAIDKSIRDFAEKRGTPLQKHEGIQE